MGILCKYSMGGGEPSLSNCLPTIFQLSAPTGALEPPLWTRASSLESGHCCLGTAIAQGTGDFLPASFGLLVALKF